MFARWWKSIDPVGLVVFLGALVLFLPFAGSYGMWDPWESHYGEAARQILERGDWWTLYWEDAFFFSKPILLFWLMGLSFSLFGVHEFAARLPIILMAVAGITAAYWGVAAVTKRRLTGVLAAAAMASIPLYAFIARQCITDMPFVASMTIALMALARYELAEGGRPRHMYMVYFFCGLATLAKGPLGVLLPGAVVLAYLILSGNWGLLRRARIPTGIIVFLTVAAPWYLTMILLHGERFINEFLIYNNVQRATGSGVHGAHADFWYYLRRAVEDEPASGAPVLQAGTFPWLSLFPAAAFTYLVHHFGRVIRRVRSGEKPASDRRLGFALLLLCWALVGFVVFSSIPTKFHHYLLPLSPPIAIIAALWLADAASKRAGGIVSAAGLVLAAVITFLVARVLGERPWEILDLFTYQYGRPDIQRIEVGQVYLVLGVVLAGILVAAALFSRFRWHLSFLFAAVAIGLTVYGIDVYLPRGTDCVSQADAFRALERERRPGDQLINWQMNYRGEVFYGRSEAVKAVSTTHLRWLLSRSERSFIVANRRVFGGLSRAIRSVTGQEPQILNPETCNTRMVLYDGPRVEPPEFTPPAGSLVDAVPESVPHRPENVRIGDDIALVGYRVDWIGAGSDLTADITLYLRCEGETDEWWKIFVHGESAELPGRRAISDHTAIGDAYPSVAWRRGDIVVDRTRLRVGWILRALGGEGEITLNVGLFHDETRAQVTPESAHDGEHRIVVGRFDTSEPPEAGQIDELPDDVEPLEQPIRFGDVATLLAREVEIRGRGRHALAEVVLYLRAEERTEEPWQIFLHAEGTRGRRAVSDHHPLSGRLRTDRWEPGRIAVDRTLLDLGRLRRGRVEVYGGMFQRGAGRAPIRPASSDSGDDRVLIGEGERR